jgi:L-ascorbate 6-phosphate lactonase
MPERSWAARLLERPAAPGAVELTWLGQSGFVVREPGSTLVVDAFLSPHPDRLVPPPDRPEAFVGLDAILVTHEHWDHLDGPACAALAASSPAATVVAPAPIVDQIEALGVEPERIAGVQPGDRMRAGRATVTAVAACHGVHVADAYTFGGEPSDGAVRFLGYVIETAAARVYHAGDTIGFDGLAARLRELRVDVAMLPVNGRRPEREAQDIVGNLEPEEAAELAVAAGARVGIPMHHDMFAANRGDPARFAAAAGEAGPALATLQPGRFAPLALAL